MMADLGIAEIRAEGRKMLAKYRNANGGSTDEAKAVELWFWGWVDELLRDPEGIDEDGIDHICAALIEVGPWDEIDGDGTEASIIADHIRELGRLLAEAATPLSEGEALSDAQRWWLAVIAVATEKERMWTGDPDPDPLLIVDRVEDTVAQTLDAFPRLVPSPPPGDKENPDG